MERGISLFIFKVKGQISRSVDLYKNSVRIGYSKNYAVCVAKLSMYTSCGSGRSQLNFMVK